MSVKFQHLDKFRKNESLIAEYGTENAHLIWCMGLYLDESDLAKLGTDGLTDGPNDKGIDFIYQNNSTLYIVQGYFSKKEDYKIEAPASKAADLNQALAWVKTGNVSALPVDLKEKISEVRSLIDNDEIDTIELLYTHNCIESENVRRELDTCAQYLKSAYSEKDLTVEYKELGAKNIEKLYISLSQQIVITEDIKFDGEIFTSLNDDGWSAYLGYVNGSWLHEQYLKKPNDLFSANYRGFMGINKRKKINNAIKSTAENNPTDFFVFNNGITILTVKFNLDNKTLSGISIINGAQTTGSIGAVSDSDKLQNVKVMCRIIECDDEDKVKKIVQYNNTQNHITTWDHYTNSMEQKALIEEFRKFGYTYSLKRGFENSGALFGIESVAQPLVAFHGDYNSANRGKNYVFETNTAYQNAFKDSKAQHILLAYCVSKAIERHKGSLKSKQNRKDSDEKAFIFLQNLKSRYFVTAVVGQILDEIADQSIDVKFAKFKYNSCITSNFSLDDLIGFWVPVVAAILPLIISVTTTDLTSYLSETKENQLQIVSDSVKEKLASLRQITDLQPLTDLATHIE